MIDSRVDPVTAEVASALETLRREGFAVVVRPTEVEIVAGTFEFRIDRAPTGFGDKPPTVRLDGKDFANWLTDVTFEMRVGDVPRVTLGIIAV